MRMNFQTMNKQRKFILIAAAIGVVAMFLPWVSFFGISVNGMHGEGFLVFLCFAGAGVVAFLGDQTKSLDKTFWFVALACGALASLIMIIDFLRALDILGAFSIGFYLAILAAIGVLASAYMFRSPGDSIKGGFDSLKNDIEKKADNNNTTNTPPQG
jgi:uncharacterized membrane protein